ncbi:MAG: P1 family peptidase [Beijerinckiaceae bacterium]
MRNLITDVPGLQVGHADDPAAATGVTALVFDAPVVASVSIQGGAPGVRDTALLEPDMTVERVDALLLSGGSAFGLDAAGGAMHALLARGRGLAIGAVRVPIVPQAILFDLLNGGTKDWLTDASRRAPYWDLGRMAVANSGHEFALGSAGAGLGATTVNLKGGLGSASAQCSSGFTVGAVVAVNAVGSATVGDSPHFWAAPYEVAGEFGGRGLPADFPAAVMHPRFKGGPGANTTIAIIATDAPLTKAQCKRLAVAAHDGLSRSLRPVHAAMDGDVVFAASTAQADGRIDAATLSLLSTTASDCLARAVARGVYEARALPFAKALPDWKTKFGAR